MVQQVKHTVKLNEKVKKKIQECGLANQQFCKIMHYFTFSLRFKKPQLFASSYSYLKSVKDFKPQ